MRTVAEHAKVGGFGDRIMATGGDPNRPCYILRSTRDRDYFNLDFRVVPGRVEIPADLMAWASKATPRGHIMVEPHVKGRHSADNKDWGWRRWVSLAERSKWPLVQCLSKGRSALPGVQVIETPTFDHALAVMAQCKGLVTTEGGLHHAAGALHKRAVVIFGAFNLPNMFGYEFHINVWEPDPDGLGQRKSHPACRAAMERITVDRVLEAMETAFA